MMTLKIKMKGGFKAMAEEEFVKKVKVLPDNLPIWIMCSEAGQSKRQLESGVNRKTTLINDIPSLIDASKNIMQEDDKNPQKRVGYASMVYVANDLPDILKSNLSMVTKYIDELQHVTVFEVNVKAKDKPVFTHTERQFGTMNDLIDYALTNIRNDTIDAMDPNDRQTQILKELRAKVASLEDRVERTNELINNKQKELDDVSNQLATLSDREQREYLPKIDDLNSELKKLKADLQDTNNLLTVEKQKSRQYINERDKALDDKGRAEADLIGYKQVVEEHENTIATKDARIADLKNQVAQDYKEKKDIIASRVDSEVYTQIQNTLEETKRDLDSQKERNTSLYTDNQRLRVINDRLEDKIDDMRQSANNIEQFGRTDRIETVSLRNTDLLYIKVFDQLAFHRKAINTLYERLSESYKHPKLIILKYDEETDKDLFYNINLFANLGQIDGLVDRGILVPSSYMSTGREDFEEICDFVMVVDYVKSSDYYFETSAKNFYMTFVQHSADIKRYNLRGLPISYDRDSMYDISYNSDMAENVNRNLRERMFDLRIDNWILKMKQNGYQ